ncbi:MAG: radical SAM protein [Longimicrobiaceae bacterium]
MKPTLDMQTSPYDRGEKAPAAPALVQLGYRPRERLVPSRFNARTVSEDGRLILWNTLSGSVSVFAAKDAARVLERLTPQGVTAPLDKASEYLSKRGYLVKAGVDEVGMFRYYYGQAQWRTDILQWVLLASEDCNFRCVYCYEKFKNGTMLPEVRQGVRALTLRRAPQLKELSISWFGGEPLYGWEAVEELGSFFKDVTDRHGIGHSQHMTTNAYLLTEERATKLLEWGCRRYQITIDGLPEEHDCKRVGRDGSPTYHVILDNLRSMHARSPDQDFSIDIRVNFDQDNFPRLGPFVEALSEDFGGDPRFKLRFRAVGKWGGPNDDHLATCGVEEQRQVVRELRKTAENLGFAQERGILDVAGFGSQVCYAARPYNFVVGATGKLMKCTVALDEMEENIVGQLLPDGEMELNHANMMKWVGPHFETDNLCQHCYLLPGCQGATCPLTRLTRNQRTCSAVKSELKQEMRYTLEDHDRSRRVSVPAVAPVVEPEPAVAAV